MNIIIGPPQILLFFHEIRHILEHLFVSKQDEQKFAGYKKFLEFYLVYKNVYLKVF